MDSIQENVNHTINETKHQTCDPALCSHHKNPKQESETIGAQKNRVKNTHRTGRKTLTGGKNH